VYDARAVNYRALDKPPERTSEGREVSSVSPPANARKNIVGSGGGGIHLRMEKEQEVLTMLILVLIFHGKIPIPTLVSRKTNWWRVSWRGARASNAGESGSRVYRGDESVGDRSKEPSEREGKRGRIHSCLTAGEIGAFFGSFVGKTRRSRWRRPHDFRGEQGKVQQRAVSTQERWGAAMEPQTH